MTAVYLLGRTYRDLLGELYCEILRSNYQQLVITPALHTRSRSAVAWAAVLASTTPSTTFGEGGALST